MLSAAVAASAAFMATAVDPATLPVVSPLARDLQTHVRFLAAPDLRGRKPGSGRAIMLIEVDSELSSEGLAELMATPGVREVRFIRLG